MNERQHFFSKIPVSGIMKIYIVLLCITITGTKTFAHEAYPEDFSLKVEDVNVITKQQAVITGKFFNWSNCISKRYIKWNYD
jgi:hypothetical protein